MANFEIAFDRTIENEGGYTPHQVNGDNGGYTFAGISQKHNPNWAGWQLFDEQNTDMQELKKLVKELYREKYWNAANLDDINNDLVAYNIFDFGVNAGIKTATRIAQAAVGTKPDGIIGPATLEALNTCDEQEFVVSFFIGKMSRYNSIVFRDRQQQKFLHGWLNRSLKTLSL